MIGSYMDCRMGNHALRDKEGIDCNKAEKAAISLEA